MTTRAKTIAGGGWKMKTRFAPGWVGLVVNPFFFARRGLARELRELLPRLEGGVVDVGCGQQPYRAWLENVTRYVGVDVDSPVTRELGTADVFYDGKVLPLADASFDGALCSQVLEHVFEPEDFLREIARVLRAEGTLVLTVPFAWDEHEQPWDFARYSSFGLKALLERAGFAVVEQRKSVAGAQAIVQLASAWVFKATRGRSRVWNAVAQVALVAPVNVLGGVVAVVLGWVLPVNTDFYLDNVVLARKRSGGDGAGGEAGGGEGDEGGRSGRARGGPWRGGSA